MSTLHEQARAEADPSRRRRVCRAARMAMGPQATAPQRPLNAPTTHEHPPEAPPHQRGLTHAPGRHT